MQAIKAQFGHPRGVMGRVVGRILAYENQERIAWAIKKLNPGPNDHILEIGFGPGVSIEKLAGYVPGGRIAGVELSDVMLHQASKRNRSGIRRGRVELKLSSASELPYPDATFDSVLAINTYHHWDDKQEGLYEAHRVLKRGGQIAIVEQPRDELDEEGIHERGAEIGMALYEAGFCRYETSYTIIKRRWVAMVRGMK